MVGDNVEQLWYGLCLVKAVVTLFVVSVVVLLCKRIVHRISCDRGKRRSPLHPMVHPLGSLGPPRKSGDSDSIAANLDH